MFNAFKASTLCSSPNSNPFCTLTKISPTVALDLVTIPRNTKCAGATGLFAKPKIKLPLVPNHTGSPALAVLVSKGAPPVPVSKPSVITNIILFNAAEDATSPIVLLDVDSNALDALETIMFAPFAELT